MTDTIVYLIAKSSSLAEFPPSDPFVTTYILSITFLVEPFHDYSKGVSKMQV